MNVGKGGCLARPRQLAYRLLAFRDGAAANQARVPRKVVELAWAPGQDLGNCHDQALVDNGTIPDPAGVRVDGWEVVVEPNEEELEALGLPLRVFSVQLLPGQLSATVPSEYLQQYVDAGIKTFKFEVGAKAGENQVFSEGGFTVVPQ